MIVRWDYTGIEFRHTWQESDNPEDHTWQGPISASELIIHAANLHLFRSEPNPQNPRVLWSLRSSPPREDRKRASLPENR